ncbi:MAG TPA: PPOX class F420-dependent oxidoreductase [Solirubrobacteraceae bacterium]
MASIDDPGVRELLEQPNYAVISTSNADGSIHSAVVWVDLEDGAVLVNSAVGRIWPTNLERDPRATVLVFEASNPYDYVEIRGDAAGTTDGADDHIDRLAKKYIGQDTYPYRQPDEQRIKYVITPGRVRHMKM